MVAPPVIFRISGNAGFTLVELSIVLVIIGLIIGGVLVGQDLIKVATIRATISQIEKYQTAVNTFRVKYNCIPGDCANATSFFGTNSTDGCPGTSTAASTGTCDGNGDGIINPWWVNGNIESTWANQQLSQAGLIPGGLLGSSYAYSPTPGTNIPATPINPQIGEFLFTAPSGLAADFPPGFNDVIIQIGSLPVGGNDFLWGSGFTGDVSQALDMKLDDGLPNSGIVEANTQVAGVANPNTTCTNGTNYATGANTGCIVYMKVK